MSSSSCVTRSSSPIVSLFILCGQKNRIPPCPDERNELAYQDWKHRVYKLVKEKLDSVAQSMGYSEMNESALNVLASKKKGLSPEEARFRTIEDLSAQVYGISTHDYHGKVPLSKLSHVLNLLPEKKSESFGGRLNLLDRACQFPSIKSIGFVPTHEDKEQTIFVARGTSPEIREFTDRGAEVPFSPPDVDIEVSSRSPKCTGNIPQDQKPLIRSLFHEVAEDGESAEVTFTFDKSGPLVVRFLKSPNSFSRTNIPTPLCLKDEEKSD